MTSDVNRRAYRSPARAAGAAATRTAVLVAAREVFLERSYPRSTVTEIARRAGVNVDTLYATVGRKPELLRAVVESAISGRDHAVEAAQRDYVRALRAARSAQEKIAIYARALAEMGPRTAPIFEELRVAGLTDRTCAELYTEITERRAANMRLFAADLRATGSLRDDLTDDDVADVVWAMNSADYYLLLVRDRGWSTERYGAHLAEAWERLFLRR